MPIVLYNVPIRTAVDVAPETVARLRRAHDNIVGVKETTKDFEHFSRVFHLCGRDTLMWSGIELLCLPLLALGGIGFVSAVANLAPSAVANMYEYWVAGDTEKALDIHYGLHPLVDLMFVETNPAPIKSVLRRAGLIAVRARASAAGPADTARAWRASTTLLVEGRTDARSTACRAGRFAEARLMTTVAGSAIKAELARVAAVGHPPLHRRRARRQCQRGDHRGHRAGRPPAVLHARGRRCRRHRQGGRRCAATPS